LTGMASGPEEAKSRATRSSQFLRSRSLRATPMAVAMRDRRSVIAHRWMGAKQTAVNAMAEPTKAAIASK
jgi:hypothetical protein